MRDEEKESRSAPLDYFPLPEYSILNTVLMSFIGESLGIGKTEILHQYQQPLRIPPHLIDHPLKEIPHTSSLIPHPLKEIPHTSSLIPHPLDDC